MKKLFLLLFCLFVFQLQVFADNNMQREFESNEGFDELKQAFNIGAEKYGKAWVTLIVLEYENDKVKTLRQDVIDEFDKSNKSKPPYKYINNYYLSKIFLWYIHEYENSDYKKLFDEEIIVDNKEWIFLTQKTKLLILKYNLLARIDNPNPKAVINNSKQKIHEEDNSDFLNNVRETIKEYGKDAVIRSQYKVNKGNDDKTIMSVITNEYNRLNAPNAPIADTSCYYLTILMMNFTDYKRNKISLKPIIIDDRDWKYLTRETIKAVTAYNLLVKACNE